MGYFTALLYWIIVAVWTVVFAYAVIYGRRNPKIVGSAKILLVVLAIDAIRDVVENVYFGFYFGSKYGVFPNELADKLGHPALLLMPKIANVLAGTIVLFILFLDWFPKATAERNSLDELASVDSLTGVFNRRHFLSLAAQEHDRASRYQRALSLLLIDIDHFKKVNDTFGHQGGDVVIRQLGRLCKIQSREVDITARLGGEEFAMLLPETDMDEAFILAERLRLVVECLPISYDHHEIRITISIGISTRMQDDGLDLMMKRADEALYESKRAGRNLVSRER